MDDIVPQDCLVVKLLRSPHAHALVEEVKTAAALKVPGIEAIYTWKDVPEERSRRKIRRGHANGGCSNFTSL